MDTPTHRRTLPSTRILLVFILILDFKYLKVSVL